MITGAATISLTKDLHDRRALRDLAVVPTGARVILDVGSRATIPPSTLHQLASHGDRLHLDVHGSPGAVEAWVTALKIASPISSGWS